MADIKHPANCSCLYWARNLLNAENKEAPGHHPGCDGTGGRKYMPPTFTRSSHVDIARKLEIFQSALESISGAVNVDYAIRRANEALAAAGVTGYECALSDEERALLEELNEKVIIEMPGRKTPGYTDEDWKRNQLLKGLVYKDLINFSIKDGFYGYLFVYRSDGKRY